MKRSCWRHYAAFLAVGLMILQAHPVAGVEPDEMLADPAQEARARDLSAQLRCLVCRNESIDESDADLARDLRLLVRERIQLGESDDHVMAYIRDRYGDYVLLNPPFKSATLFLWGGPVLLFIIGAWLGWNRLRRPAAAATALRPQEQGRLAALLKTPPEPDTKRPPND